MSLWPLSIVRTTLITSTIHQSDGNNNNDDDDDDDKSPKPLKIDWQNDIRAKGGFY